MFSFSIFNKCSEQIRFYNSLIHPMFIKPLWPWSYLFTFIFLKRLSPSRTIFLTIYINIITFSFAPFSGISMFVVIFLVSSKKVTLDFLVIAKWCITTGLLTLVPSVVIDFRYSQKYNISNFPFFPEIRIWEILENLPV